MSLNPNERRAQRVVSGGRRRRQEGWGLLQVELLEVRALLSHGLPDFSAPVRITLEERPSSVAVADFNGDDHLDIATGIKGGDVSVALGNGDGTFQPPQVFPANPFPLGVDALFVTVGDFNNDDRPDLVVSNFTANTISVLLNTSSDEVLNFGPPLPFGMGSTPNGVAVGDLNNDGNLDVATANIAANPDNSVGVRLGHGDGTFGALTLVAAGPNARTLAIGDLNGDAIPDLAVTYAANTGPSADKVGVLLGLGEGPLGNVRFETVSYHKAGTTPSSVTLADFDRDGDLDLAVTNYNSKDVSILLNTGSASFFSRGPGNYRVGDKPVTAVAADFNGDGRLDLAVANEDSRNVSILLGIGNGVFRPGNTKPTTFSVGGTPMGAIAAGDFNGDGLPDLAVPVQLLTLSEVSVLLNQSGERRRPT